MTEEQELSELLASTPAIHQTSSSNGEQGISTPPQPVSARTDVDFALWQVLPNGRYRPGARTRSKLPAAAYRIQRDDYGLFLTKISILSDDIIELPEASHLRVLEGIRKFWGSQKRYQKHGLVYKRGILLWGPPGGGKTVTSQLLVSEIIQKHDGIVILADNPSWAVETLRFLRAIEPSRPLIVILEDVDEIVREYSEHSLLAMLDGEHQTDNVVYVATTNYPERLGARIVNRPSRFDERIKIGMPSAIARMAYLKKACSDVEIPLAKWVADTDGLSIAHLRELVVAVVCLEQEYGTVIERLRAMEIRPKDDEGFRRGNIGLIGSNAKTAQQANGMA
jgi:ATPase family associated with various cellular activities (AAA)